MAHGRLARRACRLGPGVDRESRPACRIREDLDRQESLMKQPATELDMRFQRSGRAPELSRGQSARSCHRPDVALGYPSRACAQNGSILALDRLGGCMRFLSHRRRDVCRSSWWQEQTVLPTNQSGAQFRERVPCDRHNANDERMTNGKSAPSAAEEPVGRVQVPRVWPHIHSRRRTRSPSTPRSRRGRHHRASPRQEQHPLAHHVSNQDSSARNRCELSRERPPRESEISVSTRPRCAPPNDLPRRRSRARSGHP
jgi:hypothetical protein